MDIRLRRTISFTFIIAFIVCTPILLLYTTGFRYDFKKGQLQRTGALVLETAPTGAEVFLNGEKAKSKTPARLNNVLPGDYDIQITKPEHYPWKKKLTVKTQETTFAEDIILFYQAEPQSINGNNIKFWSFSPDNNFLALIVNEFNQEHVYLYNLKNNKKKLVHVSQTPNIKHAIDWSPFGSYFLLTTDNSITTLSTSAPWQNIPTQTIAKNFQWDTDDYNILYHQTGSNLYQTNYLTQATTKIFTLPTQATLLDYFISNNEVFTIEKLNTKYFLTKYPLNAGTKMDLRKIIELNSPNYNIVYIFQDKLVLIEETDQTVYLANRSLDKIAFHKAGIISYDFLGTKGLLLLQTSQELSYLDINQGNLEEVTITRYSKGLQKAKWHSLGNYVFMLKDEKVEIIELDDRNGNQTINLPIDQVQDLAINSNQQFLYYIANNQLWSLALEK